MEENKIENLSQDETYAKLETEKLLKRKKTRKIWTAVALGVAFAMALVIIILAAVPVNLKPACLSNDFESVRIYDGSDPKATIYNDGSQEAQYCKFVNAMKKAFSQKYISAMFNGDLGEYEIDENFEDFSSDTSYKSGKYVKISYTEAKDVTNKNGKSYATRYRTSNDPLTFKEAYFALSESGTFENTKIYLNVTYPNGSENKLVVITVKANTTKIYEVFKDLF